MHLHPNKPDASLGLNVRSLAKPGQMVEYVGVVGGTRSALALCSLFNSSILHKNPELLAAKSESVIGDGARLRWPAFAQPDHADASVGVVGSGGAVSATRCRQALRKDRQATEVFKTPQQLR